MLSHNYNIKPSFAKLFFEKFLLNNYLNIIVNLLLMPFAIFTVIIIRLLRPVILIRVDNLISNRVGHFAANTDLYLCERKTGCSISKPRRDFFFHSRPISNFQLKRMWDRVLPVIHLTQFGVLVKYLNRCLPGYKAYLIATTDRDVNNLIANSLPNINFLPEEDQFGKAELPKIGLPTGSPFVCFFNRDSAYMESMFPNQNWQYHDYRDDHIQNYLMMAEELTKRGYYAVRMGAKVKEPLKTNNPLIIDYAWKYRNDFLDIYLSAQCSLFVGCCSGICALPILFRRPVVIIDLIPLEYISSWSSVLLSIPKKLWSEKENRFLTFREILNSGIGRFLYTEQYRAMGITPVENTPQEIADVVIEAEARLKGIWQPAPEDELLQSRFWSLFQPNDLHSGFNSLVGAAFLRQNRSLLE